MINYNVVYELNNEMNLVSWLSARNKQEKKVQILLQNITLNTKQVKVLMLTK